MAIPNNKLQSSKCVVRCHHLIYTTQLMGFLNVVLNNVEFKDESQSSYREDVLNMGNKIQVGGEAMPETVSNMTSDTGRHEYFIARPELRSTILMRKLK